MAEWQRRPEDAEQEAERLLGEAMTAFEQGRFHELVPFAGQTAGAIHDILPTEEIVRRIVAEAEAAWQEAAQLFQTTATGV